jgi:hypothetical protein
MQYARFYKNTNSHFSEHLNYHAVSEGDFPPDAHSTHRPHHMTHDLRCICEEPLKFPSMASLGVFQKKFLFFFCISEFCLGCYIIHNYKLFQ